MTDIPDTPPRATSRRRPSTGHLITKGLTPTQHPFKMADVDLTRFKTDTAVKAKAVKQ